MATQYTGDPTAAQTPGLAPFPGRAPVLNLPEDGVDARNVSSIYQEFKALADYVAYLMNEAGRPSPIFGYPGGGSMTVPVSLEIQGTQAYDNLTLAANDDVSLYGILQVRGTLTLGAGSWIRGVPASSGNFFYSQSNDPVGGDSPYAGGVKTFRGLAGCRGGAGGSAGTGIGQDGETYGYGMWPNLWQALGGAEGGNGGAGTGGAAGGFGKHSSLGADWSQLGLEMGFSFLPGMFVGNISASAEIDNDEIIYDTKFRYGAWPIAGGTGGGGGGGGSTGNGAHGGAGCSTVCIYANHIVYDPTAHINANGDDGADASGGVGGGGGGGGGGGHIIIVASTITKVGGGADDIKTDICNASGGYGGAPTLGGADGADGDGGHIVVCKWGQ